MFIFKFVIPHFPNYNHIKTNHNCAMFILGKKAYVELKLFQKDLEDNKNIFNLKKYFPEFVSSPIYKDILSLVMEDMRGVKDQATRYRDQIGLCSKQIQSQFDFETIKGKNFDQLVKEVVQQYWIALVEGLGSIRSHRKEDIIKALQALSYYSNSQKIEVEQFDRMMSVIDLQKVEEQILKKYDRIIQ